jgi:hypothetical protein
VIQIDNTQVYIDYRKKTDTDILLLHTHSTKESDGLKTEINHHERFFSILLKHENSPAVLPEG